MSFSAAGSCLGPVEFISYTEDVVELMESHHVHNHHFANHKQLYISAPVTKVQAPCSALVTASQMWWVGLLLVRCNSLVTIGVSGAVEMTFIFLKTELIWIGTRQRLQQLSCADITLMVGSDAIKQCMSLLHSLRHFATPPTHLVCTLSETRLGISSTQENYDGPRRPELVPADLQLIVHV